VVGTLACNAEGHEFASRARLQIASQTEVVVHESCCMHYSVWAQTVNRTCLGILSLPSLRGRKNEEQLVNSGRPLLKTAVRSWVQVTPFGTKRAGGR
jgi:hypothetical protein